MLNSFVGLARVHSTITHTFGGPLSSDKVEERIKEIERRYTNGRAILKACPERFARAQLPQTAEKHGISREMAIKLRVLADPKLSYTEQELKDWYKIFHDKGHALTISHFIKLISVRRGKLRTQLTREAIKRQWSSHELQAEILKVQPRRKQGGRRPKIVASESVQSRLQQQLFSWGRWLALHQGAIEGCDPTFVTQTNKVRKSIAALSVELEAKASVEGKEHPSGRGRKRKFG